MLPLWSLALGLLHLPSLLLPLIVLLQLANSGVPLLPGMPHTLGFLGVPSRSAAPISCFVFVVVRSARTAASADGIWRGVFDRELSAV